MKILVTGGAGFIGSAVCRAIMAGGRHEVVNVDKLTYAADRGSVDSMKDERKYRFYHTDICDQESISCIFETEKPDGVLHLAAESHVDRSITGPAEFINTNILGTYVMLEAAKAHWQAMTDPDSFRFVHVSTDEVYGALGPEGAFTEETPYDPSSPYSASKAASDHLANAWHRTYGLPVTISNCSNNYGPFQFPEKLIPLVTGNAVAGKTLPIYGKGDNVRDWLHVDDHAEALLTILERGKPGESYNIGARSERTNLQVVHAICDCLDQNAPRSDARPYREQIEFVIDRPGHDFRYAIDPVKIERELGWKSRIDFDEGIASTIQWYLANQIWIENIRNNVYEGQRLGLNDASKEKVAS